MTDPVPVKIRYGIIRLYKHGIRHFIKGIRQFMCRWYVYLPDMILKQANNPFEDGEIIRVEITSKAIILKKVVWWELLEWSKLPDVFEKLPYKTKRMIFKRSSEKAKRRMIKKGLMPRV